MPTINESASTATSKTPLPSRPEPRALTLRLPPDLWQACHVEAQRIGISLTAWITIQLRDRIDRSG